MDEATYVTLEQIADIAERYEIASSPRDIAWRLRKNGWLLSTPTRGVWEFAPGAHAGAYSKGDVFAEFDGALARRPDSDLRVALVSALWLYGWSDRPPSRHEISAAPGAPVPKGLVTTYRLLRFESKLPPARPKGRPMESPATLLVHMASRPSHVSSWEPLWDSLYDIAQATSAGDIRAEMAGRPASVGARLGYLLHGAAPRLAKEAGLRRTGAVTRFGSASSPAKRFNPQWNVMDSLLPFDPAVCERTW
jgi:hypothetical protein